MQISVLRTRANSECLPNLSVDTKNKEPIGCFRNPSTSWLRIPKWVYDHDFRSLASGIAIPCGAKDLRAITGAVCVGTSYGTPEFAVGCIANWWKEVRQFQCPHVRELCILADSGGCNGYRPRAWKYFLQHTLATPIDLTVTVAHYPSRASKYNRITYYNRTLAKNLMNLLQSSKKSLPTCLTSLRAHIYYAISNFYCIRVVFYHQHRIASVHELLQNIQK